MFLQTDLKSRISFKSFFFRFISHPLKRDLFTLTSSSGNDMRITVLLQPVNIALFKMVADDILFFFFFLIFRKQKALTFHVTRQAYFLKKKKKKKKKKKVQCRLLLHSQNR